VLGKDRIEMMRQSAGREGPNPDDPGRKKPLGCSGFLTARINLAAAGQINT
jgi:hypothetical protein